MSQKLKALKDRGLIGCMPVPPLSEESRAVGVNMPE